MKVTPSHRKSELAHIQVWPLDSISPAPENDDIYHSIALDSPEIWDLAQSIKQYGVQEPLLISTDGYIISGHRRRIAASLAGLSEVPVRVYPVSRERNRETFVKLLVEMNSQRIKGADVLLHEAMIKIDPATAHETIVNARKIKEQRRSENTLCEINSAVDGRRCRLSGAKQPLMDAILRIVEEQRDYWPLTVRQIHYRLLGADAPLIHASKPGSTYENNLKSYRAAVDVSARARVQGLIPWEAIEDETRPVDLNGAFSNLHQFLQREVDGFLRGYWRNLLQSQPHHIELVTEKLTLRTILSQVAQDHTMAMTIMRGMCALPAKKKIADRYVWSRKDKLVLLVVSDLDPAGDAIAADLVKSFRRDFGIDDIEAYKVALTIAQVRDFDLAPSMEAKSKSPTYRAFVEKYGITDAYELEALDPGDLMAILKDAIEQVIDLDLFNQELATEEADSAKLVAVQQRTAEFFKSMRLK
jgi:hypothetical protein